MTVHLLLPPLDRLPTLTAHPPVARLLARADRLPDGAPGEEEQLRRHFEASPAGWPLAALTRELDAADAGDLSWLRADPAHVRADMSAVRLLASGSLGLPREHSDALMASLRPLFDEPGWELSAPHPERWYLRLPRDTELPAFYRPEHVLGDEIHDLLPSGTAGRRWRALLNEAQIVLHNHPVNAERARSGRLPVNSLWFFGGSRLPAGVVARAEVVMAEDAELRAFAAAAGVTLRAERSFPPADDGQRLLIDLRDLRDTQLLARDWLLPLWDALRRGRWQTLELDCGDGRRFRITASQRWRIWRRGAVWQP